MPANLASSLRSQIENLEWNPPGTPPSPDSGIRTPDTPSSAASEQDEATMGWLDEQSKNLNESNRLHGSAGLSFGTDGPAEVSTMKVSATARTFFCRSSFLGCVRRGGIFRVITQRGPGGSSELTQGYLAHKKEPPTLGPPQDPRHSPTAGC